MTITLNKSALRKSISLIIKSMKDVKDTYIKQAHNPSHETYFDYTPSYDKSMELIDMFNAFNFNSKAQNDFNSAKRNLKSIEYYDEKAIDDSDKTSLDATIEDEKLVVASIKEAMKQLRNFKKDL